MRYRWWTVSVGRLGGMWLLKLGPISWFTYACSGKAFGLPYARLRTVSWSWRNGPEHRHFVKAWQ